MVYVDPESKWTDIDSIYTRIKEVYVSPIYFKVKIVYVGPFYTRVKNVYIGPFFFTRVIKIEICKKVIHRHDLH